jgi:oxygen-independent coproporphyrinogen-3 oxidase
MPPMADDLSLYLHIPFCRTRCHYCDFNTYTGLDWLRPALVRALADDLADWRTRLAAGLGLQEPPQGESRAATVFLGGGTPSLLSSTETADLLRACEMSFPFSDDIEVTAEANPGTVDGAKLRALRDAGLNRLSFGVQSLDDAELRWLGRTHSAAEAVVAFREARAAGFENVNLDLIYGVPGQTVGAWEKSLEAAINLRPEHISAYALTVERGTALAAAVRRGEVTPADEDTVAEQYAATEARLAAAGYAQYEISNWALPGRACRHNLAYWRNLPYLGFGPGAHSSFGGFRFAAVKSPQKYVRRVRERRPALEMVEEIPPALQRAETVMLALRLNDGFEEKALADRFGAEAMAPFAEPLAEFRDYGLVEAESGRWRLTPRGRLLSDEVFTRVLMAA